MLKKTAVFLGVILSIVALAAGFSFAYFRYDILRIEESLRDLPEYFQRKASVECAQGFPGFQSSIKRDRCVDSMRWMSDSYVIRHSVSQDGKVEDVLVPKSEYEAESATEDQLIEEINSRFDTPNKEENTQVEKQPGRVYPITDNETYRITPGRKYVCEDGFWAESRYQEILEVKAGKKWKEVHRTNDTGDGHCFTSMLVYENSISISPLRDYVQFTTIGWEWGLSYLVNIKTGESIIAPDANPQKLVWSKSGKNYAFISVLEEFGGTGRDAVWVSKHNDLDNPVAIFDLKDWAKGDEEFSLKYEIKDLQFVDSKVIEFSVFQGEGWNWDKKMFIGELARYRYDLKKGSMEELFRKNL